MKEERLLVDISPPIIFAVGGIIFTVGWVQTGQTILLAAGLLAALGTVYTLYRLEQLYLR